MLVHPKRLVLDALQNAGPAMIVAVLSAHAPHWPWRRRRKVLVRWWGEEVREEVRGPQWVSCAMA